MLKWRGCVIRVCLTGITGNTYTPAKCEGGDASADPYTADANVMRAQLSRARDTAASCTNGGDASSEAACEGTSTEIPMLQQVTRQVLHRAKVPQQDIPSPLHMKSMP